MQHLLHYPTPRHITTHKRSKPRATAHHITIRHGTLQSQHYATRRHIVRYNLACRRAMRITVHRSKPTYIALCDVALIITQR